MSCMPTNLAFHPAAAQPVETRPHQARPAERRRPALLIRAAEAGQAAWRRERDLPRLLGSAAMPGAAVVMRLLDAEEAYLNEARRLRAAEYSVERHVLVLIALLAELRAAATRAAPPQAAPPRPVPPSAAPTQPFPRGEVVPFTFPGTARPARP